MEIGRLLESADSKSVKWVRAFTEAGYDSGEEIKDWGVREPGG